MEAGTFKSKLISLLQKSRQAARMYSEMQRGEDKCTPDKFNYATLQIAEWKNVNLELVDELQFLINDFYNQKKLSLKLCSLYERFQIEQLSVSENLEKEKANLIKSTDNNDFSKSAKISLNLISLKSRNQALEAVLKELTKVLDKATLENLTIKKQMLINKQIANDGFNAKNANSKKSSSSNFNVNSKVISINVAKKA